MFTKNKHEFDISLKMLKSLEFKSLGLNDDDKLIFHH